MPKVQTNKFLLMLPLLGLLALTACATRVTVIPETLRECDMPTRPSVENLTVGRLATFSLEQEAALQACNQKLKEVANLIEG
jgi:hypothetical protein